MLWLFHSASIAEQKRLKASEVLSDSDLLCYANRYPDLMSAFGVDRRLLRQHWNRHGHKDQRDGRCHQNSSDMTLQNRNCTNHVTNTCQLNVTEMSRHGVIERHIRDASYIVEWRSLLKDRWRTRRTAGEGHGTAVKFHTPTGTAVKCMVQQEGAYLCITPYFVLKKLRSRSSYLTEKRMCCALRGVPHMQELLHYNDACLLLLLKNEVGLVEIEKPTGTSSTSALYDFLRRQTMNASSLIQREDAALHIVFTAFAQHGIFPYDLSALNNLLRSSVNGELMVIDYGYYLDGHNMRTQRTKKEFQEELDREVRKDYNDDAEFAYHICILNI